MSRSILIIIFAIIAFFVFILAMAKRKHSNYSSLFWGVSAIISGIGGFIIYGCAFSELVESTPLAIIYTLLATLKMYLVNDEYSAIASSTIMQYNYMVVVFWIIHILALYTTANAMLTALGAPILKVIKEKTGCLRKKIVLIYGISSETITYSKLISKERNTSIVFIDDSADEILLKSIIDSGNLYYINDAANKSEIPFLKSIGVSKNKQIIVYALGKNETENYIYAMQLKDSFKEMFIPAQNTSLTLLANIEMPYGNTLQAFGNTYGYGSVMMIDRAYITAHTLVINYPPCDYIQFDTESAKAKDGESFTAIIIGFGKIGQAILKELVKNGQFENAKFKAVIFDPNYKQKFGFFYKTCESMIDRYDISFYDYSGQSKEFYQFLEENISDVDYITLCTGFSKINNELAIEIQTMLNRLNSNAAVFQCAYNGIIHQYKECNDNFDYQLKPVFTIDNLDVRHADQRAIHLNHIYHNGISAIEDWKKAGFVERMSCRASADFSPAFLRMTGLSEEDVVKSNKWDELSEEQIENLSRTEHLRWCAFHYSIGYSQMTNEEFELRIQQYCDEKRQNGRSNIRIQKDADRQKHICLTDWDNLDALSVEYRQITGDAEKDYKKDDTNNVLMFPKVLCTTYDNN